MMALKGKFKPINKEKYKGKLPITFRSSWERSAFHFLDAHPDVIVWAVESVIVPYYSQVDNKMHRYYPDIVVTFKNAAGETKTQMWEIKPFVQTQPPKRRMLKGKPTKRFITETVTWSINNSKWDAARAFCESQGWQFLLVTEKELFGR
jgi:hypothetical protein